MDKTVAEWCKARHLSRSTYHKLKNLGRGPKELEIPGTRIKRITPEADAEWETRMAELAKSEMDFAQFAAICCKPNLVAFSRHAWR